MIPPLRIAYVLLWFPKASETFVFREAAGLRDLGLDITVYTIYGKLKEPLSAAMRDSTIPVERLGAKYVFTAFLDILYWLRRAPRVVREILRIVFCSKWRGLEKTGENLWAVVAGFRLARLFEAAGVNLIHAPWALGPTTAAWIASLLTGIPFGFTARAWDIYPPDGVLAEKIAAAAFVRTNTMTNVAHLSRFAGGRDDKIHMIYNGLTITDGGRAEARMQPPLRLLAIGRFSLTKGFDHLLRACRLLKDQGIDFHLTLVGDGQFGFYLKSLVQNLGLADRVEFPGFVSHDRISAFMLEADMLVMPSVISITGDRDGIPNVILEACSHGLPVVATDVSGIGEVIIDGVTGCLVPQKDPVALARAIVRMASDRAAALAMAGAGRDRVLTAFDPDRNFRRIADLMRASARPARSAGR